MDASHWLLLISVAVITYVFGQIWFAQIVVYPLFAKVGTADYVPYHLFYSRRIPAPVIAPGLTSFLLPLIQVFYSPASVPGWMPFANAVCALVGLFITVAFEIPRHARLEKGGKQPDVIRQLILFNWPRTISITASTILSYAMLLAAFRPR